MAKQPKIATLVLIVAPFFVAAGAAAEGVESDVLLNIELLLSTPSGTRLVSTSEAKVGHGGAHHQAVKLDEDDPESPFLIYVLGYKMRGADRIDLGVKREVARGTDRNELPVLTQTISPMGSWTTELGEFEGLNGKLTLRVVPMLRERKFDEDFSSWRPPMRLSGGTLVEYRERDPDQPHQSQDRVLFRAINGGGVGVELGVPDVGRIRLSHFRFPGATECGWVRGTSYLFRVAGRLFQGWSESEILPQDPSRPGRGWTLYCTVDSNLDRTPSGGDYYGKFDPFAID
jgi:hypothetical protein